MWTLAGLRKNELLRLITGCITVQADDIVKEDGSTIPPCRAPSLLEHPRWENLKRLCETDRGCDEKICRPLAERTPGRTGCAHRRESPASVSVLRKACQRRHTQPHSNPNAVHVRASLQKIAAEPRAGPPR